MLNQQQKQVREDPLADFFEGGVEEVIFYQKNISADYKSRADKNRTRIDKLTKHITDPELKKQRKQEQRLAEKHRRHQIIETMTREEARAYLDSVKKVKAELKQKVRQSMYDGQVIMLDLVYEQKMNQKEQRSLAKQIQLIMRTIKHAETPPSIHLCSFGGGIKRQLQKMRYQHWALSAHGENVLEVAKKEGKKIVYLSPDAETALQTIEKDTAYVLGGLIDRTVLKGASLRRAQQLGIQARKLPISQFMKGRLCLNLDHVVSMIYRFVETSDWKEAFDFAAPKRWKKEGVEDNNKDNSNESESEQEKTQNCNEFAQIKQQGQVGQNVQKQIQKREQSQSV